MKATLRGGAAALALVIGFGLFNAPAQAATDPVPGSSATAAARQEAETQRSEATRLKGLAEEQRTKVVAARNEIDRLSGIAMAATQAAANARLEEQNALTDELFQNERLRRAKEDLHDESSALGKWAADTYKSGVTDSSMVTLEIILNSTDLDEFGHRIGLLNGAGTQQSGVIDSARIAREEQEDAANLAGQAHVKALAASKRAIAEQAKADAAMAAQQTKVDELTTLLNQADAKATDADRKAASAEAALRQAIARENAARSTNYASDGLDGQPNVITGPVGDCQGGDVSGFPNGRLPTELLCPLWAAPGHLLRADAAYAFNQMSEAYMMDFGKPICVTDSYRTYDAQVRLKIAKPYLAATPGKSNHGWARAVDLCGGVQRFGTPEHEWLRANASRFGWFHPAWAQQNGSKPEAWHWEFAWNRPAN